MSMTPPFQYNSSSKIVMNLLRKIFDEISRQEALCKFALTNATACRGEGRASLGGHNKN